MKKEICASLPEKCSSKDVGDWTFAHETSVDLPGFHPQAEGFETYRVATNLKSILSSPLRTWSCYALLAGKD